MSTTYVRMTFDCNKRGKEKWRVRECRMKPIRREGEKRGEKGKVKREEGSEGMWWDRGGWQRKRGEG